MNWGAQDNLSIDGLGKNEKKTYIEEILEEIFIDGDWLPETQEAEVEYFDNRIKPQIFAALLYIQSISMFLSA
ncbi:hypothetical protein PXW63_03095 [Providencia rettgeri]|nr:MULTISPECIES: hypothetical protein [Providencia]MDE4731556.1 hypothetical protein [Providencia rettgeri]